MSRKATITVGAIAALVLAPAASAFASPASHSGSHQAKVSNFAASQKHLSAAGGLVKFSADTSHAKKCQFTFSGDTIQSSTHTVSCAHGAHLKAYVPANADESVDSYKVSVVALRHGHVAASHAKSLVVTVAKGQPTPPPPPVGGGGDNPPPPPGGGGGENPPPPPTIPPPPGL